MQNKMMLPLFVLLLLLNANLFAIEGNVKLFEKSTDTVYTSQKVTVSVEVLSDALSVTDVNIHFPASAAYIVHAPKSAAYLNSVEINGTTWQMVHYDYEVYALKAGEITIPSFPISFTASMGYGQPKQEFVLKSDALAFKVDVPKGVKKNQFVLVTDNYALNATMKPEKKQLIVGDAVELTVTQKAHNVPDILLRPVVYKSNAFLRVYEKEPVLKSEMRGAFDVSRTDIFTFVANGEGNVTLAAKKILWWNSATEKTVEAALPAYTFEILPDPQIAIDAKREAQKKAIFIALSVLVFLILMYLFVLPKLGHYYRDIVCFVKEKIKKSTRRLDENLNP